jgi:hypothetical protein
VAPAKRDGRRDFTIRVRDVLNTMAEREGLPRQNVPQVCTALRSRRKFLEPLGLEINRIDGPPSKLSPTVVYHYRFQGDSTSGSKNAETGSASASEAGRTQSSPIDRIYGLMRDEMAKYGGGEAFLRWLRTDPEKDRR